MGSRKTSNLELIKVEFDRHRYHQQRDMIIWCERNFGLGEYSDQQTSKRWTWVSIFGSTIFYFKDSQDACLFSLMWS